MKEEKKSGKERTQAATRDENWEDDRLKNFLTLSPPEGMSGDYNILLRAYRGMTTELFARFIPFFVEAGHDLNTSIDDGSTFLDMLSQHRKSDEYAQIIEQAGGIKSS